MGLELVPESALSELHDIDRLEHEAAVESETHVAWRAELRRFRSRIRWRIGRSGTLRIEGRTRVAA